MASNPLNLALRFILELIALFALGYWGWTQHSGVARFLWTIGLPLLAAFLWGTFRLEEPTHPAKVPVTIPGILRLVLEAVIFGGAVWAFYAAGRSSWGLVFGLVVLGHYILSYDRVIWLIKH
jgi:hypothetical protein